jgi:hydroxylamine reductase
MSMSCNQCQEALNNTACTVNGVCGKKASTANLEDLLTFVAKGIAVVSVEADIISSETGLRLLEDLFTCVTNVTFDDKDLISRIENSLKLRDELKEEFGISGEGEHESVTWSPANGDELLAKAEKVTIGESDNDDVRSLRELIIYGLRGIGAYGEHAQVLGYEDGDLYMKIAKLLASTTKELEVDQLIANVMETGEAAVTTMALLDKANVETYGAPEISEVNLKVGDKPGILISGHDLKDMKMLLDQTKGTGIDVYTHGEMLPGHFYPELKGYDNLVANYGNAWWDQNKDFENFNGVILMTTNCIVKPKSSYQDRIYTTGMVRFDGVTHIVGDENGHKDFSALIEKAKHCGSPTPIESDEKVGKIVGGFAHQQVIALADKVVDGVKSGAIKQFVVMAGCDGRQSSRSHYTEVAQELPEDSIILTAGCAKFRYNKLDLGDIGGIPRVLDAGQCNDSYSLAVIAMKLKEVFELEDINDLPISYDIAWYEQKAVTVLLALLFLGVKGIHLGPTLPAFLSQNVANVLVENFGIKGIGDAKADVAEFMA